MDFIITNWDKVMTIFFAGLSAIFAGLSFAVLVFEYKRNNPKIVVKMNRSFANFGGKLIECVTCNIVNKGRRPIRIDRFFFSLKNGQNLMFFPSNNDAFITGYPEFPQDLNEMSSFSFSIYRDAILEAIADVPYPIHSLCFADAADNVYSYKLKKKYWGDLLNTK